MLGKPCSIIASLARIISAIGAINWGLVSYCNFNLVSCLLSDKASLTHITYGIIGLAGIISLIFSVKKLTCSIS